MKCLITNDIHLGVGRNDQLWLDQSVTLFEHIIDECHKRDVYSLCILGDFFHDRKNLYMKTMDTALQIADMLKENNIHVIYLKGNHDVFYKTENSVSSLQIFNEYPNIEIIDETTIIDNIGFVSWNGEIPNDCKYLFAHLEINGFSITNSSIFEKSKYNISDFEKYERVITGHFHIPSTKENITYLGSPYHLSFNDVNSVRGFYYFDSETGELEFIPFDGVKFIYVSTEKPYKSKELEGNIVRLIFEKDYGSVENNKIIEKIQKCNPLRFYTDFSKITNEVKTEEEKEHQVQTLKSNKEILFDFIDIADNPEHIDVKKMKLIIDNLVEE